jgi:ArsR family transcriptional regulator, arsenate/arsenite/antimonite-responsive transcriptional repressor
LKEKDMTAGEISDNFHMSKPSISNQLKILKAAELVFDEKYGQYIYSSLNSTILQDVIRWLLEKNQKGENNK